MNNESTAIAGHSSESHDRLPNQYYFRQPIKARNRSRYGSSKVFSLGSPVLLSESLWAIREPRTRSSETFHR
jgi:hypothetical protein